MQLDETKLPAHAFSVRCPECQKAITVQPSDVRAPRSTIEWPQAGAPGAESSPATEQTPTTKILDKIHFATPAVAPLYRSAAAIPKIDGESRSASNLPSETADLARALATLIQSSVQAEAPENSLKILICVAQEHRDEVAQLLADEGHHVYVAADAMQALESMRRGALDAVVLDANFDTRGQGAILVTRAISGLQPSGRRDLFVAQLSASSPSADAHAAFLQSVNLVVNPSDLARLPQMLESTRRDYDELYRAFRAVTSDK